MSQEPPPQQYLELAPPPHLAADVDSLWVAEGGATGHPAYRVLPDGCSDLIVLRSPSGALRVEVVGAMRRPQFVALAPGDRILGLRFRPGMAYRYLPLPAHELADSTLPLGAVETPWGRELAALARPLSEPAGPAAALALLASRLTAQRPAGPVQQLCAWLARSHGSRRMGELATQANLSPRQLRRLFLAQVGLGPKQLARILRFQRLLALARAAARPDWAGLAYDCGYADQAHMVHEFTALAECTPRQFAAGQGR